MLQDVHRLLWKNRRETGNTGLGRKVHGMQPRKDNFWPNFKGRLEL